MADFLSGSTVQHWLESAAQGYLLGTEHGHHAGEREPEWLLADATLRQRAIASTVQLVVGERCSLAASAALVRCAPDDATRRFFATQTLDEARHAEMFEQRLLDLGVANGAVEDTIRALANPNLLRFAEALLAHAERNDFIGTFVGQNLLVDGMAFHVFELMHAWDEGPNPKFAHTLAGAIADERRHVRFAERRLAALLRDDPARRADVERLARELAHWVMASLSGQFEGEPLRVQRARRPARAAWKRPCWQGHDLDGLAASELERLLVHTVLKEFQMRLDRIGVAYQLPVPS